MFTRSYIFPHLHPTLGYLVSCTWHQLYVCNLGLIVFLHNLRFLLSGSGCQFGFEFAVITAESKYVGWIRAWQSRLSVNMPTYFSAATTFCRSKISVMSQLLAQTERLISQLPTKCLTSSQLSLLKTVNCAK